MPKPITKVEIAFNVGVTGTPTWTDVTSRVRVEPGISIDHWRANEGEATNPSSCSFTLINNDGRFTPGNTSSVHYPNVLRNRRVRVTSTTGGVTYNRFYGYVDDWAVDWPATVGTVSNCGLSATSRMSRLGRGSELASGIESERLLDAPVAYYALGDPEGSTQAFDTSGNGQSPLNVTGSGAEVVFGSAIGPATDDLTAATFAGGKFLEGAITGLDSATSSARVVECYLRCDAAPAAGFCYMVMYAGGLQMAIDEDGFIRGFRTNGAGDVVVGSVNVCDGQTHHVAVRWMGTAAGSGTQIHVDGAVEFAAGAIGSAIANTAAFMVGSGDTGADLTSSTGTTSIPFVGDVSHAVLYYPAPAVFDARIAAHAQVISASDTQTTGEAIIRFASYVGVDSADVDATATTPVPFLNPVGLTALDAMRRIEVTENGVLYDALDGTLTLNSRDHRYNATSSFTLDARTGAVAANLFPVLDDQGQVNDITATNRLGVAARAFDQDSIDSDGYYKSQVELVTDDPDEPAARAGWVVNGWAESEVRIAEVEVLLNEADTTVTAGVLDSEPGTKITLTGLPANAPATTMTLFVEGRSERITQNEDRVTLRTSPTSPYDVIVIDDPISGVIDSTVYRIAL